MLAEGTQTPFIAKIILLCVLVLNKTVILLIDWVVCQVHILVLFVDLLSVSFWSKSSETLLEDVNPQRLIPCNHNINSQVKLVTIDKEWVRDVFRNDTGLIHIHVVNVIDNVNATALASIGWFDNPYIFLALVLLQLLIVVIEITEFIW